MFTEALIVFSLAVLIDVLYVLWFVAVNERSVIRASLSSIAIGACGFISISSAIKNSWMAIPYLLGLGVGTAVGMWLKAKRSPSR